MILRGELQPMALSRSEITKKRVFRWIENFFWSGVYLVAWYGIFYTISEFPIT